MKKEPLEKERDIKLYTGIDGRNAFNKELIKRLKSIIEDLPEEEKFERRKLNDKEHKSN